MRSSLCQKVVSAIILVAMAECAGGQSGFHSFSPKAIKSLPDIVQRANSANINDRTGLLEQLVTRNFSDVISIDHTYRLVSGLSQQDYCQAAASVLEGGLFAAGTSGKLGSLQSHRNSQQHQNPYSPIRNNSQKVRDVFGRICYIVEKFRQMDLLPEVAKFLEYDDYAVQSQALWVFIKTETKDYIKQIGKLSSSPDLNVSRSVLYILVESNSKEAVPGLIPYLKKDNFYMQTRAVEALGRIGDRSAIPHLIPLLKTERISWALDALVKLDAQEAVPDIKELYRPGVSNANVVLTSLAYFGDERAISEIITSITDEKLIRGETLLGRSVAINARAVIPALI